jgi:TolA-binding protein
MVSNVPHARLVLILTLALFLSATAQSAPPPKPRPPAQPTPTPTATPAAASTPVPAAAPIGADPAQAYSAAMADFQAGNYAKAAASLEALIATVEFAPQLEPIYFTVGSAYFNVPDYPKAITAFKAYQAKFPNGPHAAGAAFAIAKSNLLTKNYSDAAAQLAALEKDPKLHDQALMFEAMALKDSGKIPEAIAALEKLLSGGIKNAEQMRGATSLANLYAQKGDGEKALKMLDAIHQKNELIDNVVDLNATTVALGDKFFGNKQYAEALACYRHAYPREQIIKLQTDRLAAMQRSIDDNLAAARANPAEVLQYFSANNQLKEDIANGQKLLEEFSKLPTITPAIYLRLAQCFYQSDHKWEAIVVDQEILDRFPDAKAEREPALFGIIVAYAEVNQPERAKTRCEEYLRDFKDGPNAATVGYLLGAAALQANDSHAAETFFGRLLESQPKSPFREQIRYLLGNAKFTQGKYDEAITEYKKYLSEFPKGESAEDVGYRVALCALFAGKYEDAMKQLTEYIKTKPQGTFISDAKYRLSVCKYAASLYNDVIADTEAWEKEFPQNPQLGEVLALRADSYAASLREPEAVPIYIRAYQIAATDEVMNYSLTTASKLLQKQGDWAKVAELYEGFIRDKPENPAVVSALYSLGKAKAHEGKIDEAKQLSASTIKKYINDPRRDAVEQLITQLAQLCVKKKKVPPPEPGPDGVVAPTPPPEVAIDPGAELDALLGSAEAEAGPTAKARTLFAKAELARLRRQPAEEEKNIARIAEEFKPEDLSPLLLGAAGDYLLSKARFEKARAFFTYLMDEFPKSEMIDFAYNGLGEAAFQKKEYPKALKYFSDATEKIAAAAKLKEVTVGRAKTLLAMGRMEEAKKAFEQIASVREWRGETTAFSVYSLGEIAAKAGKWAEANAYFQRVYVGYQKFLPWVAKAYIASAQSFEKLDKKQEAGNTYRELLRNEKLASFPEAEQARKGLQALGEG